MGPITNGNQRKLLRTGLVGTPTMESIILKLDKLGMLGRKALFLLG